MKHFSKILCCLLVALTIMHIAAIPANAQEVQIDTHQAADFLQEDESSLSCPPSVYNNVPLYLQTDYPDTIYGSGTIQSSGCSIVSLAMVATYLTGYTYMPDELARYFGGRASNNIARLEYGSDALQLPYEKTWYFYEALEALKEGAVVIALMGANSPFTDSQHFIVLTGITEDGCILVNDPYGPNYNLWNLKQGFANGFSEYDIICGFSGAWIYRKSDMPEEPFIYYEEPLTRDASRYPDIELTAEERQLLASVIWVEARGESAEGQQAIAEIIFNRMISEQFGDSLKDVVYSAGQFHSVPFLEDAEPCQAQYDAIDRALCGPNILPTDVFYFSTSATNSKVWGKIDSHIFCFED